MRAFGLCASADYYSLIHFFRATSWKLDQVISHWVLWCQKNFDLIQINSRLVCLGDTIKVPKEGNKQPGVIPLHDSSENNGRAKKFLGHCFGAVSFLTAKKDKIFAVPAFISLHEGIYALNPYREREATFGRALTSIDNMIHSLLRVAYWSGQEIYGVLDAFFSVGKVFLATDLYDIKTKKRLVHVITKAKRNYAAYPDSAAKKKEKIKLWDRFDQSDEFTRTDHPVTGKKIEWLCQNLFWPPSKTMIRFLWIKQGKKRYLLMTSDLELNPITFIQIYSLCGKIEVLFGALKNVIAGFGYRFWTKFSPKLKKKKVRKKDKTKEMTRALSEKSLRKMAKAMEAMERFVTLSSIALGILQYLAIHFTDEIWEIHRKTSWLRTYSSSIPSEEVVKRVLQTGPSTQKKNKLLSVAHCLIGKKVPGVLPDKVAKNQTLPVPPVPKILLENQRETD